MLEKSVLRKQLLTARKSLSKTAYLGLSQRVIDHCCGITWDSIASCHIYRPLYSSNEIDTMPLIDYLKTRYPKLHISNPEPIATQAAKPPDGYFDIIVVPVIGFDDSGQRLGFGGGYYDRFLEKKNYKLAIGLAYEQSRIKPKLPSQPHDIQLDAIITERGYQTVSTSRS